MAANYAPITKAEQVNKEGGYKNVVWFTPVSKIKTEGKPVDPPVKLGDKVLISTDHEFETSDGFISWLCKKHSVTSTTETTGDAGAQSLVHKATFILLGDSATTLEQAQEILNDETLWLLRDQDCGEGDYVQFGDSCVTPNVTVEFDGKTTAEGLKEYTVNLEVKAKKFFYTGTVTEQSEA